MKALDRLAGAVRRNWPELLMLAVASLMFALAMGWLS
jgi:hypothetical protein